MATSALTTKLTEQSQAGSGWSTVEAAVELLVSTIKDYAGPDTTVVADAGSNASKALAVQGIVGAVPIKTRLGQLAGTPSNFTIGTSDGTVFTLAIGEVGFIQNLDDAALAVKKGASASTTSLSFILPKGSAADDGTGGSVLIDDWVGVVSVAAMSGSPRFIAWKQAAS